jgi:hypothetical protein
VKDNIVTILSDSGRGFGLHVGFIDHFNTQLVITLNYSAIANFHTLQITSAHAESFPPCSGFTSSCLIMAFNNGYSSAYGLKSSLNGGTLLTELSLHFVSLITPQHGPPKKTLFPTVALLLCVVLFAKRVTQ